MRWLFIIFLVLFTSTGVNADTLNIDSSVIVSAPDILTEDTKLTTIPSKPTIGEKILATNNWPVYLLFVLFGLAIITVLRSATSAIANALNENKTAVNTQLNNELETNLEEINVKRKVFIVLVSTAVFLYLLYHWVNNTIYEGHVKEWLNIIVRWAHLIAGIAWIGASFYFIFLENSLNRIKNLKEGIAGDLWAIHGGGFYYLEKYKLAPEEIPKDLHWFKYEAYFTWLTGFALLWIVYYMDAKSFLIDPTIADISVRTAIAIGIGSLVFSWLVYDWLCKSPLVENKVLFAVTGMAILVGLSWFLSQVFSPRAAYIHVGALLGTWMAANVFFVIIPSQKALVNAAKAGKLPDARVAKAAGQRSLHNNYITLPVIFIMISNHFPSTFGHEWNWAVLAAISIASAGIKHYWNLVEQKKPALLILIASVAMMIGIAVYTAPVSKEKLLRKASPVSFMEINDIFQRRCVSCHSASPTDDINIMAPNGVMYDTPDQIVKMKEKILQRVVQTKNMPQGNKTAMTQTERDRIEIWIFQGAKTGF